jgi:hypothetical protein
MSSSNAVNYCSPGCDNVARVITTLCAAHRLCAAEFCQNYLWNFPARRTSPPSPNLTGGDMDRVYTIQKAITELESGKYESVRTSALDRCVAEGRKATVAGWMISRSTMKPLLRRSSPQGRNHSSLTPREQEPPRC